MRQRSLRVGVLCATGGGLVAAAILAAAPARASCPEGQAEDVLTRMCWTQIAPELSLGMAGEGPCLPGRLGNCVGALPPPGAGSLQNSYGDWGLSGVR